MQRIDPIVSVQVSVYALDSRIREAVYFYLESLDATGISRETGSMSTVVWGEIDAVWSALKSAYESTSQQFPIVVQTTMSNAAPLPARASGCRE